jgi:hypothetical protein
MPAPSGFTIIDPIVSYVPPTQSYTRTFITSPSYYIYSDNSVLLMSVATQYTTPANAASIVLNGFTIGKVAPRLRDPNIPSELSLQLESFVIAKGMIHGLDITNTLTVIPVTGPLNGLWVGNVTVFFPS